MTTAADILRYIETIAPKHMAENWDNVGLLCGRAGKEVRTVLVALDPFEGVCREAVEVGADMIVTHHPLIFRPVNSVTDADTVGRAMLTLIAHDIAAVNAHTNLDCAPGGVNDVLAQKLGLSDVQVVTPNGTDAEGRPWGLLRCGTVKEQSLESFLENVKMSLGCPGLRYVDGGKAVRKVAVGGGACGDGLYEAHAAGCDTFVTSDIKYNQFWDAKELGLNLIDAGHFYTENPVCAVLAEQLQAAFPDIRVILSKTHGDCMKFFA